MTFTPLALLLAAAPAHDVQVTVYNDGYALVKEKRRITLNQGVQTVVIEDVAQQIEANSVGVRSISRPGSFSIMEQNYRFDIINPVEILRRSVGQEITLRRYLGNGNVIVTKGTLLTAPVTIVSDAGGNQNQVYSGMVLRTADGTILLNPSGEVEVASIPAGMISKPSLVWMINARQAGEQEIEFSYLTRGFSWSADYVLSLQQDGKSGELQGWVTMTNSSGTAYRNARLALLAGQVNRAMPQMARGGGGFGGDAMEAAPAGKFAEQQFGDYHLYKLDRRAELGNNELKQLTLLTSPRLTTGKELVAELAPFTYRQPAPGDFGTGPIKPAIFVTFKNDEASGLGQPLPKGRFKVFQRDQEDELQLVGEQFIDHTPRNENVRINVGTAFDVVVEARRTEFSWLGSSRNGTRETWEVSVRNQKKTPDVVHVIDRRWGQNVVENPTIKPEKLDNETYRYVVNVGAEEEKKFTFTVVTRW